MKLDGYCHRGDTPLLSHSQDAQTKAKQLLTLQMAERAASCSVGGKMIIINDVVPDRWLLCAAAAACLGVPLLLKHPGSQGDS